MDLRLKPQDVVVALKLVAHTGEAWTQPELAKSLHMSASEVNHGLKRLEACQLYNPRERRVIRRSLEEFLISGLRYVFPAALGERTKGLPTSIGGSPALSTKLLVDDEDHIVWAAKGRAARVRGRSLAPLYRTVPQAAAEDPVLHEYLALVDALRVGRARERTLAKEELSRKLAS